MSMIKQHGLSLIELLVFIVIVGIAVTGVLSVYSSVTKTSANPMLQKQALAVAESLLDEVLSKPYTYCDPDDANADTATSPAGCATTPEGMGTEGTEDRYSNTMPYDNVNDYNGFTMAGINDLTNTAVPGLGAYNATIRIQAAGVFNGIPAGETLIVHVTVTGPDNLPVTLSGYRTRYAPTL